MISSKGRILCTEDDVDTRDLYSIILTANGFAVTCAKDAADCIALASAHKFDLFLIDNWMPEMSGLELCKRIRQFDDTTPVLFCSGAGSDYDKQEALDAGAQGYLVKPVLPEMLLSEISRMIF